MNSIIKDKKQQEIEAEHKKYWKFPERSCQKCKKYPCFIGQENAKADNYFGIYIHESQIWI